MNTFALVYEGAPYIMLILQGLLAWILWNVRRSFIHHEIFDAHTNAAEKRSSRQDHRLLHLE